MGFLKPDTTPEITVVFSDLGRGQYNGRQIPKMRLWVLGDRTAVIISENPNPSPGNRILRTTYRVADGTSLPKQKKAVVNLYPTDDAEEATPLVLDTSDCGCSFGAVANAGPVEGVHRIVAIRSQDWWTIS